MGRFVNLLLIGLAFFGCCTLRSQAKNVKKSSASAGDTHVIRGGNKRHRFMVRVTAGPFRRNLHRLKVTHQKVGGESQELCWIDGKPEWNSETGVANWHGTDGGFPWSEFYAFGVWVDGKKWSSPRSLWQDCYCYEPGRMHARLSADGKSLEISMSASDGAGSYVVIWRLTKSGRPKRWFPPPS